MAVSCGHTVRSSMNPRCILPPVTELLTLGLLGQEFMVQKSSPPPFHSVGLLVKSLCHRVCPACSGVFSLYMPEATSTRPLPAATIKNVSRLYPMSLGEERSLVENRSLRV